ncbi:unnamed protein product [Protopolystoma xenopodis]|uniref:Uncharacterized protein n=1 Tax=Protopolystoma xenopodis TaxID=117903 RepID=A0A3S5B2E3_9PLAT|nr:unnamed protein product [Protopolystoma xenopodis]
MGEAKAPFRFVTRGVRVAVLQANSDVQELQFTMSLYGCLPSDPGPAYGML